MRDDQVGGLFMGLVSVLVGLGVGYFMYASPGDVSNGWPLWVAMLAPAAFVFGGLFAIGFALGNNAMTAMFFKLVALCLIGIGNWAAFVVPEARCEATVSFLGLVIFDRYPDAEICKFGLMMIIGALDIAIVGATLMFAWQRWRKA